MACRLLAIAVMSTGIWAAASGAVGQMTALDVSTSNLVNARTPGFRADTSVFRQQLVNAMEKGSGRGSLHYLTTRTTAPDMKVGDLVSTGRALDVAIPDEKGFFVVSTPQGERYTRAGNFAVRGDGALTTADGSPVLGVNRQPVVVDPQAGGVTIDRDGTVYSNGMPAGGLAIVTFANLGGLEKEGQVTLRARPEAGRAMPHGSILEPGTLEMSNESSIGGMAEEVSISRQFDMTSRVIEAFSNIEKKAANEIMGK